MGGDSSEETLYKDLVFLSMFLGAQWYIAYICKLIKLSPVVGYILVGILLGPNGLNFVPLFNGEDLSSSDATLSPTASPTFSPTFSPSTVPTTLLENSTSAFSELVNTDVEDFLIILGDLGVTFLIFESGLHVDFETLKAVGGRAFGVAVLGTVFSIGAGVVVSAFVGFGAYPEGLAIGAVIGPTSVGIALKLLVDANVLDSEFGQTIVTAAFTDDVFSLMTLAVLLSISSGSLNAFTVVAPFLWCTIFLGIAFFCALYIVPLFLPQVLNRISEKYGQNTRDMVHLTLLFLMMAFYGYFGELIGSHLLGAFLAGVTFAFVPRTHFVWEHNMEPLEAWLVTLFFGATVAFAIPVDQLFSLDAAWKGAILGFFTVLAKIFAGIACPKRWVIGWAMVGRGEFSFLVGDIYKNTEFQDTGKPFLSKEGFAVAVWGLLIAILVAPIGFGIILSRNIKRDQKLQAIEDGDDEEFDAELIGGKSSVLRFPSLLFSDQVKLAPRSEWFVTIGTKYQEGLAKDVMGILSEYNIHVKSYVNEGDMDTSLLTFSVLIPEPGAGRRKSGSKIKLRPSVAQMKSRDGSIKSGRAPMEFKDSFYAFDIDIFIQRLKGQIESTINDGGTVKIMRADGTGEIEAQYPGITSKEKDLYASLHVMEDTNDVDSAASAKLADEEESEGYIARSKASSEPEEEEEEEEQEEEVAPKKKRRRWLF